MLTGGLLELLDKLMGKAVGSGTYNQTTDSNEAIREAIDGLNDVSAAEVNAECDTALSDYDPPTRAELTADKDSIITEINANETKIDALNDISAAEVNAEVDNALNTAIPTTPTTDSINERIKAIDDKLPSGTISDITTAQVNTEVDNAINTAVPEPPTAKSLADILHKDSNYTYDNTTDSLEAIADAVAGISGGGGGLSAKEKSLLGIGVVPGFQDFFNTVANGAAPDSTYWSVVENGDGAVTILSVTPYTPGFLQCYTVVTGNDAIAYTKDKRVVSLKNGVTTVCLKAYVNLSWGCAGYEGKCGIGFTENDNIPADTDILTGAAHEVASIVADAGVPKAFSSDGNTVESTDLSSYISDDTWFDLEIRITSSDVKFYIDGTLRATHSTSVPNSVWQVVASGTGENDTIKVKVEKIQVWGE